MRVQLTDLEGKWYIHYSDFPMWLKGDKLNPTFNYRYGKRGAVTGLHDEVVFTKNGKQKSIVGFDTPTDATNTSFVWRGKGLLSLVKSKWEILHLSSDKRWAIIHFEKTLFTPEGYDVISRDWHMDVTQQQEIHNKLKTIGINTQLARIQQ
ncbi:hypothetical protein [Persicitalea sp.]|uniref:hypothetical protein n=1 Tax=Persicitalea sp. TaxID=3100273 RepID=UPI0035942351